MTALRNYGVMVRCSQCRSGSHTVYVDTVGDGLNGRGLCPACYTTPPKTKRKSKPLPTDEVELIRTGDLKLSVEKSEKEKVKGSSEQNNRLPGQS